MRESHQPDTCTLPLRQKASAKSILTIRRRRRPRTRGKSTGDSLTIPLLHDSSNKGFLIDSADNRFQEDVHESLRGSALNDSLGNKIGFVFVGKPPDSQAFKMIADRDTAVQSVRQTQEHPVRMANELQTVRSEVQVLNDYRVYIETTLRTCQDTYLAEAQSANNIGIHDRAFQCEAIASFLGDLRADLDFSFFREHTKLYGHAPSSTYWLDGSRMLRQRYQVLRS